jgi:uncharacterized membrane protein YhaH (DUF805 family)
MAKNTGNYFGNNFIKGWKKSFDITSKTNYADYSSFLGFNFGVIIFIFLLAWNLSQVFSYLLIFYLIADIFPMTSIVLRRFKDSGIDQRNIFWIFLPFIGWWKLRIKLSSPSIGETDSYKGMSISEKRTSKFFLNFLPWLTYKFPLILAGIGASFLAIISEVGFIDPFSFFIVGFVLLILTAVAIPSFVTVSNNARAEVAKNTLANIYKECSENFKEKGLENKFTLEEINDYSFIPKNSSCDGDENNLISAKSSDESRFPSYSINVRTGEKSCFYNGSYEKFSSCDEESNSWD